MKYDRIPPQTRVRHTPTDRTGTTCPDFMSCCSPEQTPVVWDGEDAFDGTLTTELVNLGPENAKAGFDGCGGGKGEECCIFLLGGAQGFECGRFSSLRFTLQLQSRKMTPKREPCLPYPECQKEPYEKGD